VRWFTRQLYESYQGEGAGEALDAWGAALAAYEAHLANLLPRLPESLRDLSRISLHDARFTRCTISLRDEVVTLRLVGGDHQAGYVALTIRYDHASIVGASLAELAAWVEERLTEVLYDELDINTGGGYEHRYLLWPHGEFAVRFSDAGVTVVPAPSEQYEGANGRVEIRR
jgi:hypothetical protein